MLLSTVVDNFNGVFFVSAPSVSGLFFLGEDMMGTSMDVDGFGWGWVGTGSGGDQKHQE